ncbi:MaoC/PaaZ C-terminal domain-containing protein [Gordonia sp. DT219]|uniref:MaoC/PaaZ C-terminal domain-containing protein n=1 Tax=Gordonia sp. DT219 TaxID=3416658 RepID=UPI003CEE4FF4
MKTPRPIAPHGLWLDDIAEGATFVTDTHTVETAEILEFARRYDPQIFHTDPDSASGTFFDGLAASGWHVAAITMSLVVTTGLPVATGIVGGGAELTWPSATRPGDVLRVTATIDSIKRSTSQPSRAWVNLTQHTVNQHDEVRQITRPRILMWDRPIG